MKSYITTKLRNIGVIGHGHCGKTSLVSSLLFSSGTINRLGRVDDGSATTNFDEIEIAHKLSIYTSFAHLEWQDHKINLLDTPGSNAFILDARASLRACDTALIVVDVTQGIGVGTEKAFAYADEFELPQIIFINKMDREQSNFEQCLISIKQQLNQQAILFQIPIKTENFFNGIIDLINMKATFFDNTDNSKEIISEIPPNLLDEANAAREKLIEKVAESDDRLMEKFFTNGTLNKDELIQGIQIGIRNRTLIPIFIGSALNNTGISLLLDAIVSFTPTPIESTTFQASSPESINQPFNCHINPNSSFSGLIFKTTIDQFNHISICKIISGTLKSESTVYNPTRNTHEKLGSLHLIQGKQLDKIEEAHAGDIVALTKLKETFTGDTLCEKNTPIIYTPVVFPEATISFALEPKSRADEDKLSTALTKLLEQDQALHYTRNAQTKEFLLSGTGQLHIELTVERLKKRYGIEVVLHPPKIAYRETFKGRIEVEGRHKKQSGGKGQFGDCKCIFEPTPRGSGFKFIDKIFGGAIPQNFRPAVEKGIVEAAAIGSLAGYPTVDFQVELIDGSYHTVDSDEISFKLAGRKAFRAAMEKAKLVLLEPIMHVEIVAPNEFYGDLVGDLNTRRGRIEGTEVKATQVSIKAYVPLAEMLNYTPKLNSITGAHGNFNMEFARYDEAPSIVTQKIVAEAKAAGRLHSTDDV